MKSSSSSSSSQEIFSLDDFYYRSNAEITPQHTTNSHGNRIDIKQIFASKDDIFIQRTSNANLERKKIILRPFLLYQNSIYHADLVFARIYEIFSEAGFDVYYCSNDRLLQHLGYTGFEYYADKEINDIASEQGFAKDEIAIISSFDALLLLKEKTVKIDIALLCHNMGPQALFEELSRKRTLSLTLTLSSAKVLEERFSQIEPSLALIDDIEITALEESSPHQHYSQYIRGAINCRTISFKSPNVKFKSDILWNFGSLNSIEQISFDNIESLTIGPEIIIRTVSKISSIKTNILKFVDLSEDAIHTFIQIVNNIEATKVTIVTTCIPESLLLGFLSAKIKGMKELELETPYLRFDLKLISCESIIIKTAYFLLSSTLNRISFSKSTKTVSFEVDEFIVDDDILLASIPSISIKAKILGFNEMSKIEPFIKNINYIKANKIFLRFDNIELEILHKLLQKVPDVEELELGSISSLDTISSFEIPDSLKKLSFSKTKLSFSEIKKLLQKANDIKRLTIEDSNLEFNSIVPSDSTKKTASSSFERFSSWLKTTFESFYNRPNEPENLEQTTEVIKAPSFKIPSTIEEIVLRRTQLAPDTYAEILALPNLKTLNLDDSSIIPEEITIPRGLKLVGQNRQYREKGIDGNTGASNNLHGTRVFKPKPHGPKIFIPEYRVQTFTEFNKETWTAVCNTNPADCEPITDIKITKNLFQQYSQLYEEKSNYFLGRFSIPPGSKEVGLTSLTVDDQLEGLEIISGSSKITVIRDKKTKLFTLTMEQSKSEVTGFYMIKSPYGQKTYLSYFYQFIRSLKTSFYFGPSIENLEFDEKGRLNNKFLYRLSDYLKLKLVCDYFKGFERKPLSKAPESTKEAINLILKERAGVCRHAAYGLFAVLQELGIKSLLTNNEIHQYIELINVGDSKKLHFGGISDSEETANGWSDSATDNSDIDLPSSSSNSPNNRFNNPSEYDYVSYFKASVLGILLGGMLSIPIIVLGDMFGLFEKAANYIASWAKIFKRSPVNEVFSNLKSKIAGDKTDILNKVSDQIADIDFTFAKDNLPNFNNLLLIMASTGSAVLMLIAAKYFYKQEQKRLQEITATDEKQDLSDSEEESATEIITKVETKEPVTQVTQTIQKSVPPKIENISPEIPMGNPFIAEIENQLSKANNIEEYVYEVMKLAATLKRKNILCVMARTHIESFYQHFLAKSENVYFISNLDEISLEDTVILNGETIQVDSKLASFIKSRQGTLIVDWTKHRTEHIGFNSMTDAVRRIYQLLIDNSVPVISIIEEKMGDDFYSRQKMIRKLAASIASTPKAVPESFTGDAEISFFSDDWQRYLFGRIKIDQVGYIYTSPKIFEYLQQGKRNIVLRNAPWENREFRLAITDIEHGGKLYINGQEFNFPGVKFFRNDAPFSLENLEQVEFSQEDEYHEVNQENFQEIFERYHINARKLIIDDTELKEKLIITENLSSGQWAQLASINAKVVIAKGVDNSPFSINLERLSAAQAKIIVTNDFGLSKKTYEDKNIIHIGSETTASDLIDLLNYDKETKFFDHDLSAMAEPLLNGEEVILVGSISTNLAKQLASLFLPKPYMMINGERTYFTGRLVIITKANAALSLFEQEIHSFTSEDIWQAVRERHGQRQAIEKLYNLIVNFNGRTAKALSFNYDQICTMLRRMELKPYANPLKHILRLQPNYNQLKPLLEQVWDKHTSVSKPSKIEKLTSEFAISSIPFIVGESGAGKTTFMHSKELRETYEVLEGLEQLAKLAQKSEDGKPRLLFLEEANLVAKPDIYEVLRGALSAARTVLVGNKLIPLDPDARIVFVGNYRHFRGRKDLEIINDYGSIISFKKLDDSVLVTGVIKPILATILSKDFDHFTEVANLFVEAYNYINNIFPGIELLTTRNLERISFRYGLLYQGAYNIEAAIAIYDEIAGMLKKSQRQKFKNWLEDKAGIDSIKIVKDYLKQSLNTGDFFVPKSWKNSLRLIDQQLAIRDLKIQHSDLDASGINALLIEGKAGRGKSYRLTKFLEFKGFQNADDFPNAEKKYYLITPTDFSKAEEILSIAADEGSVVIIDEFNTMPLESILNRLLSGYKLSGEKLASKGFTVFATQNPTSYGKRLAISEALTKRLQKIVVKDLKREELFAMVKAITDNKMPDNWLNAVVAFYSKAITYAESHSLPIPNLRHLTDYAKEKTKEFLELSSARDLAAALALSNDPEPAVEIELIAQAPQVEESIKEVTPPMIESSVQMAVPEITPQLPSNNDKVPFKFETFIKSIDSNIRGFIDDNYKAVLFRYICANNPALIELQNILNKPYVKESTSEKVQSVLKKPIYQWKQSDLNQLSLGIHPDKYMLNNPLQKREEMEEDFKKLSHYKEILDTNIMTDNLYKKLSKDFDYSAQLHTLNFVAKEADIIIDLARLSFERNIQNALKLGRDVLMLGNHFYQNSKLGYILPIFSVINVAQNILQQEYWKAGVSAIHGFSHHLINNPKLFSYGTPAYTLLNAVVIGDDIYQGKYLAATVQTAGAAMMYLSPTVAASIYAVSYTAQNAYELYLLYQNQTITTGENIVDSSQEIIGYVDFIG